MPPKSKKVSKEIAKELDDFGDHLRTMYALEKDLDQVSKEVAKEIIDASNVISSRCTEEEEEDSPSDHTRSHKKTAKTAANILSSQHEVLNQPKRL